MTEDARLDGRVAIVTGGARGIGEAIVRALHARGAQVVICDNGTSVDGTESDPSLAQEIAGKLGDGAVPYTSDMSVPAAATEAVALAREKFGGLDIVVNNAAILRDSFLFKGNPHHWDAVIRNNLSGAYYLLAAAAPILRENAQSGRGAEEGGTYGWGRIVNIVSTAAFFGNFGQAAYAASKAGLMGLMRIAALDMARSGVTANAVAPLGRTRMVERIHPANETQATYKEQAMKVPPGPVGAFVAYLCSPAAQNVSGQLFAVRGREVMLFSQPRPLRTVVAKGKEWAFDELSGAVEGTMRDAFVDLITDPEAFHSAPVV